MGLSALDSSFYSPTILEFPHRVPLSEVRASNSLIASTLSAGLVAVFVGATNGIGEITLKQFAKHTRANIFVKADLGLMSKVDAACGNIKDKEKTLNHLFFAMGDHTAEVTTGLTHHSRAFFLHNLLPLLQASSSLRRVVTFFNDEQHYRAYFIHLPDLRGRFTPLPFTRSHATTFMTPSLVAAMAPNVSFVNCFRPGWNWKKFKARKPNVTRLMRVKKAVLAAIEPLVYCYLVEPGACNLFLATSARYPASVSQDGVAGVPADSIATGIDKEVVGGVYSINVGEENMGVKVTRFQAWKKRKAS